MLELCIAGTAGTVYQDMIVNSSVTRPGKIIFSSHRITRETDVTWLRSHLKKPPETHGLYEGVEGFCFQALPSRLMCEKASVL